MATSDSELVTVRIEPHSDSGVDLLQDVLRQLNAMVRLLSEFATDPNVKVEVRRIEKASPLMAELRVVSIKPPAKAKKGAKPRRPVVRASMQPIRRFERVYASATSETQVKTKDADGLSALGDFARQLKDDVATITTATQTMVVGRQIIDQVNRRLGPIHKSRGTVAGVLESLNVHASPWHFYVYPESGVGPSRIRCTFDESLFPDVQRGLRHSVVVHGLKDYVAGSPWPLCVRAEQIEVREPAKEGAWLQLAEDLASLWESASEMDRATFLEVHSA